MLLQLGPDMERRIFAEIRVFLQKTLLKGNVATVTVKQCFMRRKTKLV